MGQIEAQENNIEKASKNHFDFKYVIGRGGFGKVWKVSYKKTGSVYALKEMSKVKKNRQKKRKKRYVRTHSISPSPQSFYSKYGLLLSG